ncbi:Imm5 family immunity protein [Variovorax robiniae]|uniref:Imm5 family immunity protein n=1 Tax=Variovorax robiniae TaxID=1836199 RepID=A0ABU8XGW8_9BURK
MESGMAPSQELAVAIQVARHALGQDRNGELRLPERKAIWAAMGPTVVENGKPVLALGSRRRLRLAILTAEHVLPVWAKDFPANQEPQHMLAVAEKWLAGHADFQAAWMLRNSFWSELSNIQSVEAAAGFATCQVLATALGDEKFTPQSLNAPSCDQQLDPDQWDAGFYASIAHAGAAPWEQENAAGKRRAFWQWYLAEAVPQAWRWY